jgi:hypothetical protein
MMMKLHCTATPQPCHAELVEACAEGTVTACGSSFDRLRMTFDRLRMTSDELRMTSGASAMAPGAVR